MPKATRPAKKKKCQKGYPCKMGCISVKKNCRNPLKWQAKDLAGWLKLQEERLVVTNQKRSRAGLTPATMNDMGYISADRIKRSGSVKLSDGMVLKIGARQVNLPKPLNSYSNLRLSHDPSLGWQVIDSDGDILRQPANGNRVDSHRFRERSQAENFAKAVMAKVDRAIAKIEKEASKPKKTRTASKPKAVRDAEKQVKLAQKTVDVAKTNAIARKVNPDMDMAVARAEGKLADANEALRKASGETTNGDRANSQGHPDYLLAKEQGEKGKPRNQDSGKTLSEWLNGRDSNEIGELINRNGDRATLYLGWKKTSNGSRTTLYIKGKDDKKRGEVYAYDNINMGRTMDSFLDHVEERIKEEFEGDKRDVPRILLNPKIKTATPKKSSSPSLQAQPAQRQAVAVSTARKPAWEQSFADFRKQAMEFDSELPLSERRNHQAIVNAYENHRKTAIAAGRPVYELTDADRDLMNNPNSDRPVESKPMAFEDKIDTWDTYTESVKKTLKGKRGNTGFTDSRGKPFPATVYGNYALSSGGYNNWQVNSGGFRVQGLTKDQGLVLIHSLNEVFGKKSFDQMVEDSGLSQADFWTKQWEPAVAALTEAVRNRDADKIKAIVKSYSKTSSVGDRASVVPEPPKEKRSHPMDMSRADKMAELKDHYESSSPIPQFRKGLSGKYAAVGSDNSTYGKQYETESDGINAAKEARRKRAEDSVEAMRYKSDAEIDRQIEYWRKERGIETMPVTKPDASTTYQPTAKEFGDRLNVTAEDFKGNALYLGIKPNSDGYEYSYKDKEWIKSKYGEVNYGDEYRIVKDGDYIAIESRPVAYKKDGDPISDRLSEGDWKSWYGKQNISWNQESLVSKIANFNITEKPHPLVTNANADKEKRRIQKEKAEKERQIKAEQQQAELTAWTAIKKEMVKALPKPKQKQSVTWMGEDGKERQGIADLYGDNYAITRLVGSRGNGRFSVADVSSGFRTYTGGLTATEAKELLGILWKERGDKPIMKDESLDISDDLLEVVRRYGYSDGIPKLYSQAVTDRLNAGKEQKAQALQSNLFGGLDEIPVDEKREAAIAAQSEAETTKKMKALEGFRPSVKPRGDNLSDKELEERIKESNDYFNSIGIAGGKRLKKATEAFYRNGDPTDRFLGSSASIESIFKAIDDYKENGSKQKVVLTEWIDPYSSSSTYQGRYVRPTRETRQHILDPSDERMILDFMRDNMNVNVSSDDTIEDVRKRFDEMKSVERKATNLYRPKWLDTPSSSVTYSSGVSGIGLTPTTKGFVAEQLFKLGAFDFPSRVDYDKEPPMVTIRTPGGGQYQIYKTKEALSTFLGAIGLSPKKGESLFDSLKRNSEKVQNFSELTISPRDRHLLLLAATAANRILEYPEFLRQGILNRLGEQLA